MSTHNIPFSIYHFQHKKKITLNYSKSDFLEGTHERVRNSRGKRATSVRATEYDRIIVRWNKSTIISLDWLNTFRIYFRINSSLVCWCVRRQV